MELKKKVISFLGDSITEGVGVQNRGKDTFAQIIGKKCKCKRVLNFGIGGTRIAHQIHPSEKARWDLDFCGRCWNLDYESDIIVVLGGVNDYFHGDAPFGTYEDNDRNSFCGSVDYLCRTIRELYPNAVPVFFAPAHSRGDNEPSTSEHKPETAAEHRPLIDYVNAIMTIAKKHGFYTYSLYDNLGIDPKKPEDWEKYTTDGVHFNELGHQIIADKIIDFLKSI